MACKMMMRVTACHCVSSRRVFLFLLQSWLGSLEDMEPSWSNGSSGFIIQQLTLKDKSSEFNNAGIWHGLAITEH